MNETTGDNARSALEAVDKVQQRVSDDIGLPRWYWWMTAAGWVALGVLGTFAPVWAAVTGTVLFGALNATLAGRLYDGTRGTAGVRLHRSAVSRRLPWLIIAVLMAGVLVTIGLALWLDADGAAHAGIVASVVVAVVIGLGGPEILRTLRHWAHA